MQRTAPIAFIVTTGGVLVVVLLSLKGCRDDAPPPLNPGEVLSVEAAALPPGVVKVRLIRRPAGPEPEQVYEWAVLASLQDDKLGALPDDRRRATAGQVGGTVTRYRLTVKVVGDNEGRSVPENERTKPGPGRMFVRHEGEMGWSVYFPGVVNSHSTAQYAYHIPGRAKLIRVYPIEGTERLKPAAGDPVPDPSPPHPTGVDVFRPWTYSVTTKQGPLSDVIVLLLAGEVVVGLPTRVEILRVGDAVTALDLRP